MNRKKRDKNRATSAWLENVRHTCPKCGNRGKHWFIHDISLSDLLSGKESSGFWICEKAYGPDGLIIKA
jgi:hypothetical protein